MSEDEHDWEYMEDAIRRAEIKDMQEHCPGCPAWLGAYYMCMYGGKDNCIYVVT